MTKTTKTTIAIDLDQLRGLMHEFCNEQDGDLVNRDLLLRLTLSQFLRYLETRQPTDDNSVLIFSIEKGAGK
jgi:hypothetical protein